MQKLTEKKEPPPYNRNQQQRRSRKDSYAGRFTAVAH